MQRVTKNDIPLHSDQAAAADRHSAAVSSPLLPLARRIREEQGVERLKEFFAAMTPFAAPNELMRVSESFGISFQSIGQTSAQTAPTDPHTSPQREAVRSDNTQGVSGAASQMQMLQKLMLLQNLLNGAGRQGNDPSALLKLLGNM